MPINENHETDNVLRKTLRNIEIMSASAGMLLVGGALHQATALAEGGQTPNTELVAGLQPDAQKVASQQESASQDVITPPGAALSLARTTRAQKLKQDRICRLQLERDPFQLNSCQYPTVYAKIAKKDPNWVREHRLPKPGSEDKEDRRKLLFKVRPDQYHEYQIQNLPPKDAARLIWAIEADWTEEEIAAGMWIIDHENAGWNPCAGNGDNTLTVTCKTTSARNGTRKACGIPQFQPCRLLGDKVGQLRAFVVYVETRYGSALRAKGHKIKFGWY